MTNFDNDNTLVLFVNEYKEPGSKQPDYKGKATVGGIDYKCAGWKKSGKNTGSTYLSVKLEPTEAIAVTPAPPRTPKPKPSEDDVPF